MPFTQNANFMRSLYVQMNSSIYHSNFLDLTQYVPGLRLEYPGNRKKQVIGDYRLRLNGCHPSHPDIIRAIHDYCLQGERHADSMHGALRELSVKGLDNTTLIEFPFEINNRLLNPLEFNFFLYWLILQEDINYPRNTYMGVRMPLIRYVEAVISARHPTLLEVDVVVANANPNRRGAPSPRFMHPQLPREYDNTLSLIENMPI